MADAIWDGYVNGDWNTTGTANGWNWNTITNGMSSVVPTGTATFPGSGTLVFNTNLTFSAAQTTIQNIVFQSPITKYLFAVGANAQSPLVTLIVAGNGLSNANGEQFTIKKGGVIDLINAATADQANITLSETFYLVSNPPDTSSLYVKNTSTLAKSTISNVGHIVLQDQSTSASTTISNSGEVEFHNTANAGTVVQSPTQIVNQNNGLYGRVTFWDSSSAGYSVLKNTASVSSITFFDASSAGHSTISNSADGNVSFYNNASAAFSAITNSGNSFVAFDNGSTGGRATIVNGAGCFVDLTGHGAGQFDIGSISGSGSTKLGAGVYVHFVGAVTSGTGHASAGSFAASSGNVPSLNMSIGGISGGGGIIMDSSGTLTLTGANSYTGDTIITNGTLELAAGSSIVGGIAFQGWAWGPATLKLDTAGAYSGLIKGVAKGDAIDLAFHPFSANDHAVWVENAANNGGTLTFGTGTTQVALNLAGVFTSSQFGLAADGSGGTLVSDLGATQSVSQALASLSANAGFGRIDVVDTSANVLANLSALGAKASSIASITLTDASSPTLSITAAQSVADHAAIMAMATPVTLQVTDTSSGLNTLMGGHGTSMLTGGPGLDTVVFTGFSGDYAITQATSSIIVADSIANRDGTDTLINVQRVQFQDELLAFDINGDAGQAYRLYQAAFARTPDTAGVSYWTHQLDLGLSLNGVAQAFIGSAEFQSIYGANPSTSSLVMAFYTNVLGRAPDSTGLGYWVSQVQGGMSIATLLTSFSESAENQAQVLPTIKSGIALELSLFS